MSYDKEDIEKSIFWLRNRMKFNKFKDKIKWKFTTKDRIDILCKKYKVCFKDLMYFRRNIPEGGIDEMALYNDFFKKFNKNIKPKYYVIGDDKDFKNNIEKKRDPILLAESPFGNYFYVLGAWDEEVKIMHELWKNEMW
jgi:hypothetical protein